MPAPKKIPIPIIGGTVAAGLDEINPQETVNMHLKVEGSGAKNKITLRTAPGNKVFSGVSGGGKCRCNPITWNGYLIVISDDIVARISEDGSPHTYGVIDTSGGRVSMVGGRDYIMIVDGTHAYAYDTTFDNVYPLDAFLTGTTTGTTANRLVDSGASFLSYNTKIGTRVFNITDGTTARITALNGETEVTLDADIFTSGEVYEIGDYDFPSGATQVTYSDGYFIVNNAGTDEFYISQNADDPTQWSSLDFATAEAKPDDITAHCATEKDLYLAGDETIQVYYNSKNADFPYDPYPGGTINYGIDAPFTLYPTNAGIILLAKTKEGGKSFILINGFTTQEISGDINEAINDMTTTSDAFASVYKIGEDIFYQVTFPSENVTYEYIVTSNVWVTRETDGVGRYRLAGIGYVGNKIIGGDYTNGTLYELDKNTFTDNGSTYERRRRTQNINIDDAMISWSELILDIKSGVGTVSGSGSDPNVIMKYSDDNGNTWSSALTASMGKIGEYTTRCIWHQLGTSRDRIFEFYVTDPVDFVIINAFARVIVWP